MDKIANEIQLVSLHIPKTAGTSFRNILKGVYGRRSVARLDITKDVVKLNEKRYSGHTLKSGIKVVHGHFKYDAIFSKLAIERSIPIITWLRNPVERVVSNYFYLRKIIQDCIFRGANEGNLGNRMIKSLEEYAVADANRNRMSKFLRGANLDDFFFIGFVETFDDDLRRLSHLLNWKSYPVLKHNQTRCHLTS